MKGMVRTGGYGIPKMLPFVGRMLKWNVLLLVPDPLTLVRVESVTQTVAFRDRPDALLPPQELPEPRELVPRRGG